MVYIQPALRYFTHDGAYVSGGCERCRCANLNGSRCMRYTCKHRQCCWQHSRLSCNAMYGSADEYSNATDLERESAQRAFHQRHYDQVLLRKAASLAARKDATVPIQLESAYRAAHENGSIDLRLSGETPSSPVRSDGDEDYEASDVEWSDDDGTPPDVRIYLLYGGRGREDEDRYATGPMASELARQLKMRYAHVTFEVEPIGVTAHLLRTRLTPDGGPTRSLVVLWRGYARAENRLFPDFARFQASMPRPEGPRHSLRSGSRSDSLRGFVMPVVLKCTIAPGISQKGTRARPRFSSALLSPAPLSSPLPLPGPVPPGPLATAAQAGTCQ